MHPKIEMLKSLLGNKISKHISYAGEDTFEVEATDFHEACKIAKEECGFDYYVDCCATDLFTDHKRFKIHHNLVNIADKARVRIATYTEEEHPVVDSVFDLWPAASWNEREQFDMMGIKFKNHPDLRRMFMPEVFEYFPLRKEFPLIGIQGTIEVPEKDPPKEYK